MKVGKRDGETLVDVAPAKDYSSTGQCTLVDVTDAEERHMARASLGLLALKNHHGSRLLGSSH